MKIKQNKSVIILFITSALLACTGGSGINNNNHNANMQEKIKSAGGIWHIVGDQPVSPGEASYTSFSAAPDGTLYIAFADKTNGDKATVMAFNKIENKWHYVGPKGFSDGATSYESLAIAPDGTPYVAFTNATKSQNLIMYYNKSLDKWSLFYNLDGNGRNSISFSPNGDLYYSFTRGGLSLIKKYNKSNNQWAPLDFWSFIFTQCSGKSINSSTLDPIISNDYYYVLTSKCDSSQQGQDPLNIHDSYVWYDNLNSSNSSIISAVIHINQSSNYRKLAISNDNNFYIAFADNYNQQKASAMVYDQTNNKWNYLGQQFISPGETNYGSLSIAPDNTPYFIFSDHANEDKASVVVYNKANNQWIYMNGQQFVSSGAAIEEKIVIAKDGTPYISFKDMANGGKATVMAYY